MCINPFPSFPSLRSVEEVDGSAALTQIRLALHRRAKQEAGQSSLLPSPSFSLVFACKTHLGAGDCEVSSVPCVLMQETVGHLASAGFLCASWKSVQYVCSPMFLPCKEKKTSFQEREWCLPGLEPCIRDSEAPDGPCLAMYDMQFC